jgi:hypothetical protein
MHIPGFITKTAAAEQSPSSRMAIPPARAASQGAHDAAGGSTGHEIPTDPALARVARAVLERWLLDRLPDRSRTWLEKALGDARREGPASADFAAAWSSAGRRLGRAPLLLSEDDGRALVKDRASFVPAGWGTDELGRALLLLAATEGRPPDLLLPLVEDLFRKGEMREQQALLRVLAYLPESGAYAKLAAEAVRSNVVSVLEALGCENPFPAARMDELAFNQMVMKAVFNGLPLARIVGLPERADKELGRMARALASERRAAGRTVPQDLQDLIDLIDRIDVIKRRS